MEQTARDTAILAHLEIVKWIALRYARAIPNWVPLEDLIQEGIIGLIHAADTFDPAKDVPFRAYAIIHIRYDIVDYLRRSYRMSRPVYVSGAIEEKAPDELLLASEHQEIIELAARRLPAKYRTVVLLYHFEGLNLKDVGQRLGVTESWISQILAKAHNLMRPMLRQRGIEP